MDLIRGTHHLTLSVGDAQEDYDFHVGLLGLRCVKKTVLFDGTLPIYHLYYGNTMGDESTLLTAFPFRQAGLMGRPGSNQMKVLNLSVPTGSLGFWGDRLMAAGVPFTEAKVFDQPRLQLAHPCGIEYALVGVDDDDRAPWTDGGVPAEHAIRGVHGVTVSVKDMEPMAEFVGEGLGGATLAHTEGRQLFEIGNTGRGRTLEILHEPHLPQATWRFGEGVPHHMALSVDDHAAQMQVKDWLEGLGYTDCSESKDRQYFFSVYMRSPGGALVEIAYSREEGFLVDEVADELGQGYMLPPRFKDQGDTIWSMLTPLDTTKAYDF